MKALIYTILILVLLLGCKGDSDCPNPPIVINTYINYYKKAIMPYNKDTKIKFKNLLTNEFEWFHVLSLDSTFESAKVQFEEEECAKTLMYEQNKMVLVDSSGLYKITIRHFGNKYGTNEVEFSLNNRFFGPEFASLFGLPPRKELSLTIDGKLYEDLAWKFYDSSRYLIFKPHFGILRIVTPEKAYEYSE